MSDAYVWVSASYLHPFLPNDVVQAYWKEERQPRAWGAGVSPPPGFVLDVAPGDAKADSVVPAAATGSVVPAVDTASCDCGNKCVGLDWDSSSGDDGAYHVSTCSDQRLPAL